MKKSDKKLEQMIIAALTEVCESSLKELSGFQWLTHTVNYKSFPDSLRIYCVFESAAELKNFLGSTKKQSLAKKVQLALFNINVSINNPLQQIRFDCEEKCLLEHNGNWKKRLA